MTAASTLQQTLSLLCNMDVDLVLNNNRTTMLSILEKRRRYVRLSVHRMFLKASASVLEAVVSFIKNRRDPSSSVLLQDYINQNLPSFRYEDRFDTTQLRSKGEVYDLKTSYQEINSDYFDNQLQLHITWFGSAQKKRGRQMTYGLYNDPLKLIKIHRLLDRKECPKFYLDFVIYHEMLHAVCAPKKGVKRTRIHTPEFRAKEKLFRGYHKAILWEKESRHLFFR